MVDKIANSVSNLDIRNSKNTSKPSSNATKLSSETIDNVSDTNVSDTIRSNKKVINELASSAPVDADKVSKIKQAISSGRYPLDLDKISDALMQAYREMKS